MGRRVGPRFAKRLAEAQIRHRPLRALTVFSAVLLATACVTTIVVLDHNTVGTRRWISIESKGDPDLIATFPDATLAEARQAVEDVAADPDVDAVLGILRWRDAPPESAPVQIVVGDPRRFRFLDLEDDDEGEGLEAGRAVLGPLAGRREIPERVGPARVEPGGRALRRYFAHEAGADAVFVPGTTPGLDDGLAVQPVLWLRTESPAAVRARLSDRALVRDAPHRALWMSTEDSAMRSAVKVASLLALVLSAFVLAHMTRVGLLERARELAVLRALGMPRRRIVRQGMLEVALLAVPGALVGVPVGTVASHVLGRLSISTLGRVKVWFLDFPEADIALVLAAGIAIPLLGAWISLRTILRLDAATALGPVFQSRPPTRPGGRTGDIAAGTVALVAGSLLAALIARPDSPRVEGIFFRAAALVAAGLALVLLLPPIVTPAIRLLEVVLRRAFGAAGRIAARTGAGGGRGFRPAIVGVVGVFVLVLTLKNLVLSMREEITEWGREALDGRALVHVRQPITPDRLETARQALPTLSLVPVLEEWTRPFCARVVDLSPFLADGILSRDEAEFAREVVDGRGVVVSRAFALQYGVEAGGTVVLPTTDGTAPVRIAAVTDRFGALGVDRGFVLVGRRFGEERLGVSRDARPVWLLVRTKSGRGITAAEIDGLRTALGPRPVRLKVGEHELGRRLGKTKVDFRVFDAVGAFLAVLAAVGTVGTIFLRALERRRELALLRALGTTRPQFRAFFTAQGFAVGLLGGTLALVLAVPFTAAAVAWLRQVSGMDVGFVYSIPWAAACLVLAAGLGAAAGLLASHRARRLDWAASLKFE